ncbi:MAG: trigger factor family protein [Phycisphaerales bacterium]|nr:trigger factor family protein [Phycisphaerales bacterium]
MTETAETTETRHIITVEDDGPSRKKLIIEIPAEVVDEKIAGSIDTVAAEAEMPGFRKGRAPIRLVEKKFGELITREAKSELVTSAYSAAIEEHKLKVIGDPIAGDVAEHDLVRGQAFKFEIAVEVMPEFDVPSLEGIKVAKPPARGDRRAGRWRTQETPDQRGRSRTTRRARGRRLPHRPRHHDRRRRRVL